MKSSKERAEEEEKEEEKEDQEKEEDQEEEDQEEEDQEEEEEEEENNKLEEQVKCSTKYTPPSPLAKQYPPPNYHEGKNKDNIISTQIMFK